LLKKAVRRLRALLKKAVRRLRTTGVSTQ
jgi:hypothetical protein